MRQTLLFLSFSILVLTSCQKTETIDSNLSARPGGGNGGGGSTVNLTQGLVAFYPFNGNANDASGNGNNGTVNGATLTTDRFNRRNRAYSFDNSLITIPHKSYLGFSYNSEFSVSLWALKTNDNDIVHFIGKRSNGAQTNFWQIYTVSGGIAFQTNQGFTMFGVYSAGIPFPTNIWANIVGTYGNGSWKLYLNGNIIATDVSSFMFNYEDINAPLTIGNSGGFEPFYGKIDDVRIYNRALSQAEITYLATH